MELALLLAAITTNARTIISGVILCVVVVLSIAETVIVLMQKSDQANVSAISGVQESFYGKNKGRTLDSKLKLWTIIIGALIAVLCIVFFIVAPTI